VEREAAKRIKRNFGQRLRDIRKKNGLSQETLALMCGLDRTYIGGVERGERNISLVNIYKIARALKIKPEVLLQ
jgi:transcriptional regulator with XRE-family HTH domain